MSLSMNSGWIRVHIYCEEEESVFEPLVKFPGYLSARPLVGEHIEGFTIHDAVGLTVIKKTVHVLFQNEDSSVTPGYNVYVDRV